MTQLDLPQLSLERYVDLVRRRRWQLVPISLLGLVVGGLVAFFIPRYYVASVVLEHKAAPGQIDRQADDPYKSVVNNAQDTIELAVGDAMRALRWPEGSVADLSVRTLNEQEVRDRVDVEDRNANVRNRDYAQIRIVYRDRDGDRAATFANTLATVWMEKQVGDMRAAVDAEVRRATDLQKGIDAAHEQITRDKHQLEQRYGIRPDFDLTVQRAQFASDQKAHREERERLLQLRTERDVLAAQIATDNDLLARLPERITPDPAAIAGMVKGDPLLEPLLVKIEYLKLGLTGWQQGHPKYQNLKREIEQHEQIFRLALVLIGADSDGTLPNPEFAAVQARLAKAAIELAKLESQIRQREQANEEDRKRLKDLEQGYAQLATIEKRLGDAKLQRDNAIAALRDVEETRHRLTSEPPIRVAQTAPVPPHPTDPNIVLVALIGCVLGLGVAVGLILLLDVLQGSFKTVDDVERGLMVPVLGGLSHLETAEERLAAARSRRRAAAAAFGFVGLVVVVVTIFYVAPTRLPAVVRDLLTLLLGA